MEDPNDQENLKLKLPRRFGKFNLKPPSPKDTTPIIMNGNPIDRSDLTPIVEDKIFKDSSPKINLLETPNAVHELFLNKRQQDQEEEEEEEFSHQEDQSLKQMNEEQDHENDEEQEEEEDQEKEQEDQEEQNTVIQYRKFNPPFPEDKIISKPQQSSIPNKENLSSPVVSNRLAFVETVESTLESPSSSVYQKQPRITSPTDSPENKQRTVSSYPSKTLVQTQLPIKNQSLSSYAPSSYGPPNSSPPSPKLVRDEKSPTFSSPPVSQQQKTSSNVSQGSFQIPQASNSTYENKNPGMDDLIGKAHDCFLKYQILQKSWPEYKFPNLDEKLVYQNPQLIIDTYNKSVERIQIDMDVNQYKIALIIMFLVIEVVCVKFLGLDAGGYTLSQIKAMNRYEKLLIEIGEKRLLAGESNWPPEVRILFIGLLNCGLFILMKYLSSVLGPDLVGYISPIVNGLFSGVMDNSKTASLPDEIPQRQQDITGMLGSVASMAASALGNGSSQQNNNYNRTQQPQRASRRPIYRE